MSETRSVRALWVQAPGMAEIRTATLPEPAPDEVLVRTCRTGVSRGTERLVFHGRIPASQYSSMRAPFQEGTFPGPVKYGYLNVGVVEQGPADLRGRHVFCLYPHQTRYVVPATSVVPLPEDLPLDRAVLAGTMETAVNALWDAAPVVGDRIAVIGAGMVGCCIARLLARIPGVEVTLVDIDPDRGEAASALGARFATPATAPTGQDLMFHTSATPEGLELALELLVPGGEVVELSWFGDTEVPLRLGGPFHSGRLAIRGSQVGTVAPRRSYRTTADRMTLALELLRDPALDHVIGTRTAFDDLPHRMHELVDGADSRCHIVTYERA